MFPVTQKIKSLFVTSASQIICDFEDCKFLKKTRRWDIES